MQEWDSVVSFVEQAIAAEVKDRVLTAARKYAVDIDEAKLEEIIRGDQERYLRAYKDGYKDGYEEGYRRAREDYEQP